MTDIFNRPKSKAQINLDLRRPGCELLIYHECIPISKSHVLLWDDEADGGRRYPSQREVIDGCALVVRLMTRKEMAFNLRTAL